MIFSFAMSRLLYQLARQRLESGTAVGTLEQLIGSQTLGSAFKTHLELQSFNILGLILLCVWLLSPIGGQSLLRILHEDTLPIETRVVYFDNLRQELTQSSGIRDASYHMALLAPEEVKRRPEDLWGNVKIPMIERGHDQEWTEISAIPIYSALVGIPIANVSRGNSTFSLESGYLNLTCDGRTLKRQATSGNIDDDTAAFIKLETVLLSGERSVNVSSNGSWYGIQHKFDEEDDGVWFSIGIDRFVDHVSPLSSSVVDDRNNSNNNNNNNNSGNVGPTRLIFQARDRYFGKDPEVDDPGVSEYIQVYRTECRVRQKYVESRVLCVYDQGSIRPACRVVAQRPSQEQHPAEDNTFLSGRRSFYRLSRDMPRWYRGTGVGKSDPMLLHLYDPSMADYLSETSTQDLRKVPDIDFSVRLSQVINSFILAEQLGLSANPQFAKSTMFSGGTEHPSGIHHKNATADTTNLITVYRISWPWMLLCILSCTVLAAAGIFGVMYAHSGSGPNLLGFASTMLRDSKYIDMYSPDANIGYMEGSELARLLKNKRIRYGRVRGCSTGDTLGIGREEEVMKSFTGVSALSRY